MRSFLPATMLLLASACAQTQTATVMQNSPRTELTLLMFDSFERVAVYCNKAVPSNAETLNNALRVAKASIDIAAGEYIAEVGSDAQELFNPEARAQWYRASDEMLAIVQRADPKRYCTWWPGNLLKLTPEIALREFRTGYREAKQRNASGAKGK